MTVRLLSYCFSKIQHNELRNFTLLNFIIFLQAETNNQTNYSTRVSDMRFNDVRRNLRECLENVGPNKQVRLHSRKTNMQGSTLPEKLTY